MGIKKKHVPGDKCCRGIPPCEILASNEVDYLTEWTEIVGTWSTGTTGGLGGNHGYWETSSAVAAIRTNLTSTATYAWQVGAVFTLTPSGTSSWRLAGGGSDVNNYVFAEVRLTLSGGNYYLQTLLGVVSAGVTTYYGEDPYDELSLQVTLSSGSVDVTVQIFWDHEGTITAVGNTSAASSANITRRSITPPGDFAGLFVTSLNGTLRMKLFQFEHMYNTVPAEHFICERSFESKAKGIPTGTMTVKITDPSSIDGPWCSRSGDDANCTGTAFDFDCANIAGEHTVNFTGDGDGGGTWESAEFVIDSTTCTFAPDPPLSYDLLCTITVTSRYVTDGEAAALVTALGGSYNTYRYDYRKIIVTVSGYSEFDLESCTLEQFELYTSTSITTMSAYTNVPRDGLSHGCVNGSLTCEIKT